MSSKYTNMVNQLLPLVGGKENVKHATHCMTRLHVNLVDYGKADMEAIKKLKGILGCVESGDQLQIIIGTTVSDVYPEFCKAAGVELSTQVEEHLDKEIGKKKKLSVKGVVDSIFGYLSGSLTPIIPVLISASLCKTVVAVFGPQLLGIMSEGSNLYQLFTILGDTGFYFLPVFLGATAALKQGMNMVMGVYIGALMIHPTLIQMAANGTAFSVYGIPASVQNYSSTVLPILLTVAVMGPIERFIRRVCPDVLKTIFVPFFTLLIATPLALCVLGPVGGFLGNYISGGIIALYDVFGPLALALLGGFFGCLVMTGMHTVLFVYLFTTFPMLGYDGFMIPGMIASSWAGTGVAIACLIKFKKPENKSMVLSYILTWFFGGVGEPMLYGLNLTYRTTLYASIIAGVISGFVTGLLGLKAYVLSPSNGLYGLLPFMGGPTWNYIALVIMLLVSLISGFVVMMFFPLKDKE